MCVCLCVFVCVCARARVCMCVCVCCMSLNTVQCVCEYCLGPRRIATGSRLAACFCICVLFVHYALGGEYNGSIRVNVGSGMYEPSDETDENPVEKLDYFQGKRGVQMRIQQLNAGKCTRVFI